jgi:hypothetical protein
MWRRRILVTISLLLLLFLGYQFAPPPAWDALPAGYTGRTAAWVSIEWSIEAHTPEQIQAAFAPYQIDDLWVYTSYLKPDGTFNETYAHAAEFNRAFEELAPHVRRLAWIGVPISITQPDGTVVANRLNDPAVRAQIAEFCAFAVETLGFDGVHLNAELIPEGDPAFLQTLEAIRKALPEEAWFSTTAHALRLTENVTWTPYPAIMHHWSAAYLQQVAQHVDQIGLMAYDSGLPFAADYRAWMTYQTQAASEALANSNVELFIGLPVSQEWTPSHQTQAETLAQALAGFRSGLHASRAPQAVTGLAIYPHWEMTESLWEEVYRAVGSAQSE